MAKRKAKKVPRRKKALVDLDGTLADFEWEMTRNLEELAAPGEPARAWDHDKEPPHIKARRRLIKKLPGFWSGLREMRDGFDVLDLLVREGYAINVLTKAPAKNYPVWSEKAQWCDEHLSWAKPRITMTEDKEGVDGDLLLDDWPEYVGPWLDAHPDGWVIMPAHDYNKGYRHPRCLRYDGRNLAAVKALVAKIKERP